jgi:FkbM family methyltransferase
MTLKHRIRKLALHAGLDVRRFNVVESAQARLAQQLLAHQVDCVVDVGAHEGGYGNFLREGGYAGPIVSFEPLSHAHAALSAAVAADSAWQVAPRMALGETAGQALIHIAGNATSSSLLAMKALHADAAPESRYVGSENVAVMALDGYRHATIDGACRPMLKIDTQGYEMPVLRGAQRLLTRAVGVQLELSVAPLYEGQALYQEVMDHLGALGFELWNLLPGFVDPASGRMLQFDGVFFRPADSALAAPRRAGH